MAKSTISYLKTMMPGQTEAWYERIASDILSGKMPYPRFEGDMSPSVTVSPTPTPTIVNPARQRFTEGTHRSSPPEPIVTTQAKPAKPKSKTKQLKNGTYQSPNTPNTVGEALQQASQKPKRPAQPANATTKWKLERLVHSDKRAAERLAAQVAATNPGKSEQWCWEKAIYDLERDRF